MSDRRRQRAQAVSDNVHKSDPVKTETLNGGSLDSLVEPSRSAAGLSGVAQFGSKVVDRSSGRCSIALDRSVLDGHDQPVAGWRQASPRRPKPCQVFISAYCPRGAQKAKGKGAGGGADGCISAPGGFNPGLEGRSAR